VSNSRALAPHLARLDLDLIEKFLVATFMIVLAARLVPVVLATGALPPMLLLMSEGVVVLFILLRRPTQDISRRGGDWLLGLAGTLLPLLAIPPVGSALLPWHVAETVMIAGFLLQLSAKLTLRRSFGVVAANRGIQTGGTCMVILPSDRFNPKRPPPTLEFRRRVPSDRNPTSEFATYMRS